MGRTSNEAKQNWNKAHYTQVKVSVLPQIAAAFKEKCLQDGVSMAGELSRFMSQQTNIGGIKKPQADPYGTRPRRRKLLFSLIEQLEEILEREETYWRNIPINLQNGERYEAAGHTATALEDALDILHNAYW